MFTDLSATVAVLAIVTRVVVASPPACLIGAINTQGNPHDIEGLCSGDIAKEVAKALNDSCGGDQDIATDWFASVCKDAGVTIPISSSSSASTSDPTPSTKASPTDPSSATNNVTSATGAHFNTYPAGTGAYPIGTGRSFGSQTYLQTAPTNNGTFVTPSGNTPTTTGSVAPESSGAASLARMDFARLAAVGIFGAIITL